jgi:hypothetical protein
MAVSPTLRSPAAPPKRDDAEQVAPRRHSEHPERRDAHATGGNLEARARLWWWARALTAATIGWNSLEAIVAGAGGVRAGSIALVGFGLDSAVEVSSALVIVWRLMQEKGSRGDRQWAEHRAVRLIAVSFFAIAAYITYDGISKLVNAGRNRSTARSAWSWSGSRL